MEKIYSTAGKDHIKRPPLKIAKREKIHMLHNFPNKYNYWFMEH